MIIKLIITFFIIGHIGLIVLCIVFGLQKNTDNNKLFNEENDVKRIIIAKVPFNELMKFYQMYKSGSLSESEKVQIKGILQDALSIEEYEKVKRYVIKINKDYLN
ncbi:hypothetical protein [Paenibacillus agricola]|uniref:Uncharacterized protein n=1 Tax=Paenibacillus agricola TaxID=2716264 RepID=A0ABX0JKC6_9BACL|nr:hypothetical protein [Paenibacillus agricola]NHN34335.1 hypothetical protein [Paenibacillus agricola]